MHRKSAWRKNSMVLKTRVGGGRGGGKPRVKNPLAEEPLGAPEPPLTKAECLNWLRELKMIDRKVRHGQFAGLGRECGYTHWSFMAWMNGKWPMSDRAHARIAPVIKRVIDGDLAFTRPIHVIFSKGSGYSIASKPYNPKEEAALEPKWPFV